MGGVTDPLTPGTQRLWTLDVFRGIAILWVVAFHVLPNRTDASWLQVGGALGVSGFFCLSGFSVHLAKLSKHATQHQSQTNWNAFFIQRFWRLYPPYLGAMGCAIALNFLWALLRQRHAVETLPSGPNLLSHLLLVHSWLPDTIFGIVPAFWFIGTLAHLYLLYPLWVWLVRRFNRDRALLVVLAVTFIARDLSTRVAVPAFAPLEMVIWNTAFHRWFEWCFGAWIAEQYHRGIRPKSSLGWVVMLVVGWGATGRDFKLYYEPVLGLLFGGLIWNLSSSSATCRPIWKPFIALGQISYSIYLLHQLLVPYLRSPLLHMSLNAATHIGLLFVLTLLVTVPLATIYHHVFKTIFSRQ
jgi:peptidoglycan/LPS O-acetylase OafA/YrhL